MNVGVITLRATAGSTESAFIKSNRPCLLSEKNIGILVSVSLLLPYYRRVLNSRLGFVDYHLLYADLKVRKFRSGHNANYPDKEGFFGKSHSCRNYFHNYIFYNPRLSKTAGKPILTFKVK